MKKTTKKFFDTSENVDGIRINKYLSDAGVCSRREADKHIERKEVTIDEVTAVMGDKVSLGQKVSLLGKLVKTDDQLVLIAFHKPKGIVCTTDPRDPDNIIDYINYGKRIYPIGRLDKDSEGLILLTNHGEIVNKILRAGNHHEKEYIVTVNKPLTVEFLKEMAAGVPILDTVTKPCTVEMIDKTSFRIVLTQGLNRQVRRMCEYLEFRVRHLQRIRVMNINLGRLTVGGYRNLTDWELDELNLLIKGSTNEPAVWKEVKIERKTEYSGKANSAEQKPRKSSYGFDKSAKYKTARTKYVKKETKDETENGEKKAIGPGSMERFTTKDTQRPAKGRFAEQKPKKSEYKSNRFERSEKSDKTDKYKTGRSNYEPRTAGRSDAGRNEKREYSGRNEHSARTERPGRNEHSARTERPGRTEYAGRTERPGRTEHSERTERLGKGRFAEQKPKRSGYKSDQFEKSTRFDKSDKPDRYKTGRSNYEPRTSGRNDTDRNEKKETGFQTSERYSARDGQSFNKDKSAKPEIVGKRPESFGGYKKGTDRKKTNQKGSEQSYQTRRQDDGAKKGTYQRSNSTSRSGKQGLRTGRPRDHK